VKYELEKLGLKDFTVNSGETEIRDNISDEQLQSFKETIHKLGLELIDDKTSIIIEKIKNAIRELIYHTDEMQKINFSEYISNVLGYDYKYLSNLFSAAQGSSIEKYFIKKRIERVKELLIYNEISLNEIAYKAHYSSVAHLSGQFKKETGLTPSYFKKLHNKRLKKPSNL
jgi:AraC-like DNA-binding protein